MEPELPPLAAMRLEKGLGKASPSRVFARLCGMMDTVSPNFQASKLLNFHLALHRSALRASLPIPIPCVSVILDDAVGHIGQGAACAAPGERKTERAGPKGQTFHGHGTRGKRTTNVAVSKLPSLQTSKLPLCVPRAVARP